LVQNNSIPVLGTKLRSLSIMGRPFCFEL